MISGLIERWLVALKMSHYAYLQTVNNAK